MNKKELIKSIQKIDFGSGDHRDTKDEHYAEYALREYIIELVEQLDEPQKDNHLHDVKSQIEYLLEHGPGKNKSLRMLENMVDNMLQGNWALARVQKEKVKVPVFVAEWFEENEHNLNFAIFELCEAGKAPVDLCEGLTDFEKWFYLNQDIETLVRMVDGYEVEEQLYIMPLPYVELSVHYCIDKDGKVVFRQGNAQKFTEEELDEYFPDIKHFAVKV
ncbi:MAG: DUF1642 domain-containing protein [Enterococcus hulanensis]